MDRAAVLMTALRAKAALGNGKLDAAEVEALASALGLAPQDLPALVAELQRRDEVALVWGGGLELLQEPKASGSEPTTTLNLPNATFGPGATIAGRDATGASVTLSPELAQGQLAALLIGLRELRPTLTGEAGEVAAKLEQTLVHAPTPGAAAETRRSWAETAGKWLKELLNAAPQAEALERLGSAALKAFC